MKRQLAAAAAMLTVVTAVGRAQAISESEARQYDGRLIHLIIVPVWATRLKLPLQKGQPFQTKDVVASELILSEYLENQKSDYGLPTTFDVTLLFWKVTPVDKEVEVIFTARRVMLTEEDTPGRALDEASTWSGISKDTPDISFDFGRDQRLGLTFGMGYDTPRHFWKSGVSLASETQAWVSATDNDFFEVRQRLSVIPGINHRLMGLDCGPEFDANHLPFATGDVRNASFTAGCSYRFESKKLESWRASARYRFGVERLDSAGIAERSYVDHGFEADFLREYSMSGGFVRLQPWIDGAHSDQLHLNLRAGARVRLYHEVAWRTHSLLVTDVAASGGSSLFGPVPANRAFVGGAWMGPQLLEQPLGTTDYEVMGPVLRGYGFAQFSRPSAAGTFTQAGTSFAGISLTLGFPGYTERLFDKRLAEYKDSLDALAKNVTATTQARALSEFLGSSGTIEEARDRAKKRVQEIQSTLNNLIDHASAITYRPIGVVDYGMIGSRGGESRLEDWSAGGGLRFFIRGLGVIEALYVHNGRALPYLKSANWLIRYSIRSSDAFSDTARPKL